MVYWRRALRRRAGRADGAPPASWDVTLTQIAYGDLIVVTATATPETPAPACWQWYVNGQPQPLTTVNRMAVGVAAGESAEFAALALATPDIDAWRSVPRVGDGRLTIEWIDVDDVSVAAYRVDWAVGAPTSWSAAATVRRDGRWRYEYLTPPFDDGVDAYLRVVSLSAAGDEGDVLTVGPLPVRRRPDDISVSVSYAGGTQRITIS